MMEINMHDLKDVGDNVKPTIVDGMIVLVIDPTVGLDVTDSGKNMTVATSRLFKPLLDNELVFNLWVGRNLR